MVMAYKHETKGRCFHFTWTFREVQGDKVTLKAL